MKFRVLPRTLWETLGSRKLSGSSSSPSLSQALPFWTLPVFFWAFPSSSDKSLSDSARMSSILKQTKSLAWKKTLEKVWAKSGPTARTVLDLWPFALGASASLSDSSCSSEASFLLLLRASALRMLERTLWCSGGSMLFTRSNLQEQRPKWRWHNIRRRNKNGAAPFYRQTWRHISPKLSD